MFYNKGIDLAKLNPNTIVHSKTKKQYGYGLKFSDPTKLGYSYTTYENSGSGQSMSHIS